jgi:hypothetical protein
MLREKRCRIVENYPRHERKRKGLGKIRERLVSRAMFCGRRVRWGLPEHSAVHFRSNVVEETVPPEPAKFRSDYIGSVYFGTSRPQLTGHCSSQLAASPAGVKRAGRRCCQAWDERKSMGKTEHRLRSQVIKDAPENVTRRNCRCCARENVEWASTTR